MKDLVNQMFMRWDCNRNLEIKVKVNDFEKYRDKILDIKAKNFGVLIQIDTYFIVGKYRLKLREEGKQNYLVFYFRKNIKSSKESKYFIIYVNKILLVVVKKIFLVLFGEKIIVNKKRELFIYKNTRIHFDSVISLGNFIELETVFKDGTKDNDVKDEHNFVITNLDLDNLEKVAVSYSDLILGLNKNNFI